MRKKILFSLALASFLFVGSINTDAVTSPNLRIDADTVVYTGDEELYIREEPSVVSRKVGILNENQSAIMTGKEENNFVEVTSGDVTGWVYKVEHLISGKELKEYILSNVDDFDIEVQATQPVGLYTDLDRLEMDNLNYSTKGTIRDTGRKIKLYKTSTLSKYIEGFSYYEDYIRITHKKVILDLKNKVVLHKGDECKLINSTPTQYVVKQDGVAYKILKESAESFYKEIKVSNIADVDFAYNTMYDVEVFEDNVARVTINDEYYYISTDDLYIFYTIDRNSLAFQVANSDRTYKLDKIVKDGKYYKLNLKNELSKTEVPAYVTSDDCNLLINFEDCEEYVESEDTDNTNPDIGVPDYEKLLSDSVYKDKYHYEYDNSSTDERNEIVNYALSFLGNPYVYGGTSLTNGIDCSAFCMKVLQHFGKDITRTTATQVSDSYGKKIKIKDLQPGDLIYYTHDGIHPYHVVMYLGGDKCVNASCRKYGICISTIKFDSILCIKNYID